jgi:hypothetical protein
MGARLSLEQGGWSLSRVNASCAPCGATQARTLQSLCSLTEERSLSPNPSPKPRAPVAHFKQNSRLASANRTTTVEPCGQRFPGAMARALLSQSPRRPMANDDGYSL